MKRGHLAKIRDRLSKSRESLLNPLSNLFSRYTELDDAFWDELEEILVQADLGFESSRTVIDAVRTAVKKQRVREKDAVLELIRENLVSLLPEPGHAPWEAGGSLVILLGVGVNGTGKTTTLGKLGRMAGEAGRSIMFAAADTYRAAAIEQLEIWGERTDSPVIRHQRGGDPAAVVFDAISSARSRSVDLLLVDTAGRLHTQDHLMEELMKVQRVAARQAGGAKVLTMLVVDATTGQNGLAQARLFNEAMGVDFVALTKLDGTAKGGIVVSLHKELGIPIEFVGLGEGPDDLEQFDRETFVQGLLS
ncbi:MAG: signal recognition particle-docking protein FtsY [Terriglobia bacterium]